MDHIAPVDYARNVDVRASKQFHLEEIEAITFAEKFVDFVKAAQILDVYKKAIFYNKPAPMLLAANKITREYDKDNKLNSIGLVRDANKKDTELHEHLSQEQKDILHAVIGIATEAGELIEALIDGFSKLQKGVAATDAFDHVNLREEVGDVLWYVQLLLNSIGSTIPEAMTINDRKLETRYGPAFSESKANERDLSAERTVLEGKE